MKKYIWRDSVDPDQIMIGIKYKDDGKYYAWISVFVDGVSDIFDIDHNSITTTPREIEIMAKTDV